MRRWIYILSILVLPWSAAGWAAETRVALIIGNSDYAAVARLRNPAHDAALMADTLRALGFDVELALDAGQKQMQRAIQRFGQRLGAAGKDSVGLFYYAGHGIQAHGENFLIPTDAKVKSDADLDIEAVNANWILRQMEAAAARINIVVLDACRNNPFPAAGRSAGGGLGRMDAPAGTLIAYATAPGKVAMDGDGANSPFTGALAPAMRRPGLTIEEMFKEVRKDVQQSTRGLQVPWEATSLTGRFAFVAGGPADTPVAAAPRPAPGGETQVEVAFWQSIQSSKDARDFEAYLKRYGDRGVFSMLAANRVAALRADGGAARGVPEKSDQQLAAEALIRARKMIQDMVANAGSLMGAKDADPTERVNKFRGMLGTVVDFKPMARFVLGKHYESVTPEQWERFFLTYKELFLSGYEFSAAKAWTGKYELETVREYGDDILVTVKFVRQDAGPLRVGFRIRRRPESFFGYKIIDALTDGMSLVVTQRNDFAGLLASGGIDGLIQTLENRFGKAVRPIVIPD